MTPRESLIDYAEEQLMLAGRSEDEVRVVLNLLETLVIDWPSVDYAWALETTKQLLDGDHLQEQCEPIEQEQKWTALQLGDGTRPGHRVRVVLNAYTEGRFADQHNGREGVFAGARNGFVYVKYDDELGDVHPAAHRVGLVEKAISQG